MCALYMYVFMNNNTNSSCNNLAGLVGNYHVIIFKYTRALHVSATMHGTADSNS